MVTLTPTSHPGRALTAIAWRATGAPARALRLPYSAAATSSGAMVAFSVAVRAATRGRPPRTVYSVEFTAGAEADRTGLPTESHTDFSAMPAR